MKKLTICYLQQYFLKYIRNTENMYDNINELNKIIEECDLYKTPVNLYNERLLLRLLFFFLLWRFLLLWLLFFFLLWRLFLPCLIFRVAPVCASRNILNCCAVSVASSDTLASRSSNLESNSDNLFSIFPCNARTEPATLAIHLEFDGDVSLCPGILYIYNIIIYFILMNENLIK
mgnify:CR=1 FL=1